MRTFIITLGFIILLAGAACSKYPYERGQTKHDGTYQNQPRNDRATQGGANQNTGRQEKKSPDPYDSRYDNHTNRQR